MPSEVGLVLLGQQAVISNPSVAMLRVSGKHFSQEDRFFKTAKHSRTTGKLGGGFPEKECSSLKAQIRLGPSLATHPQQYCRISKPVQPLGDKVPLRGGTDHGEKTVRRRASGATASSSAAATSSTPSSVGAAAQGIALRSDAQSAKPRKPSVYADRTSRSFSAGSVRLHRRASTSDDGEARGKVGEGGADRQRRNMSCTSLTLGRRRNSSVEPQVKRRLPSTGYSHRGGVCNDNQRQKRPNTAERKARHARMEEFCLMQQQKAMMRVEERRKHAIAQRQKAETDEIERRQKARERYRIRELEAERRRQHIYALNCVMRQVESRCFEAFKQTMEKKALSSEDASDTDSCLSDCDSDCDSGEQSSTISTTIPNATALACKI